MERLLKYWICSRCGDSLPTGGLGQKGGQFGYLWRFHYQNFLKVNRKRKNPSCGHLCDTCNKAYTDLLPLKELSLIK